MESGKVYKLARALRVLLWITMACNMLALVILPWMYHRIVVWAYGPWEQTVAQVDFWQGVGFWGGCGICTFVILWQAVRILGHIIRQEAFHEKNAVHMRRAAAACFVISALGLVVLVFRLVYWLPNTTPQLLLLAVLTPNRAPLAFPVFFMAGLLFLVMSALFR